MPSVVLAAGAGQAVFADPIHIKSILLTAGSANATLALKGAGTTIVPLAALAGTSVEWTGTDGANQFSNLIVNAPVTVDIVGTGAQALITF